MKIKRKGQSVQELMGIKSFTEYGLATNRGELLFFSVAPTNISVLSQTGVGNKIHHLMMVLSTIPDIEIVCTDASECFDDNKQYLTKAALRVGWEAELSVFNKDFNPKFLKRIRAYDNNGKDFDIEMNFKLLENKRYVSDGNKDIIVIREKDKDRLVSVNMKSILY